MTTCSTYFFEIFYDILPFVSLGCLEFDPQVWWAIPHWWTYVAYVACFSVITLSIVIILTYGQYFGKEVSLMWLTSLLASFFEDFFLMYPILVSIHLYVTLCDFVGNDLLK